MSVSLRQQLKWHSSPLRRKHNTGASVHTQLELASMPDARSSTSARNKTAAEDHSGGVVAAVCCLPGPHRGLASGHTPQATIEALRAQLEAARHAPLRAAADGACGGVKFGGAAHGGASQAAGRAATALADALPGLRDALQEEVQEGAGPPGCSSDGSPGGAGRQSGRAGCAQGCGAGQQAGSTDVCRATDSLRQLKQLLGRASMFHEVRSGFSSLC